MRKRALLAEANPICLIGTRISACHAATALTLGGAGNWQSASYSAPPAEPAAASPQPPLAAAHTLYGPSSQYLSHVRSTEALTYTRALQQPSGFFLWAFAPRNRPLTTSFFLPSSSPVFDIVFFILQHHHAWCRRSPVPATNLWRARRHPNFQQALISPPPIRP